MSVVFVVGVAVVHNIYRHENTYSYVCMRIYMYIYMYIHPFNMHSYIAVCWRGAVVGGHRG